jgi:hypothetical protein
VRDGLLRVSDLMTMVRSGAREGEGLTSNNVFGEIGKSTLTSATCI